jgi:hypothetical protein
MTKGSPPEKLDMQVSDMQPWLPFQFLTSLLRRRGGWSANHGQDIMAAGRRGYNRRASWLPSLSLGRSAKPVRNTLGMISKLLINTPLQRGDSGRPRFLNRFSGFPRDADTAEAVVEFCGAAITPLKRGVNESCPAWDAEFPGTPV